MPPKRQSARKVAPKPCPKAAVAAPVRRKLKKRDTEQAVDRLLDEAFPDLDQVARDGLKIDGCSLRERLLKERRTKHTQRFSRSFLRGLRKKYAPQGCMRSKLQLRDDEKTLPLSHGLSDAMLLLSDPNPNKRTRLPLISLLAIKQTLNRRECVALLRLVIDNNPGASAGNRQLALKILSFLIGRDAQTQWHADVTLLNPLWDLALSLEYSAMKAERVSIEDWWANYQHCAVVLPVCTTLNQVITFQGAKHLLFNETEYVVNHSKLGSRMYAAKLSEMRVEKVSNKMRELVDGLATNDVDTRSYVKLKDWIGCGVRWGWAAVPTNNQPGRTAGFEK